MKIFCNTTPIIALCSIGQLNLLPKLFNHIHLAEAVLDECSAGGKIAVPDLRKLDWVLPVVTNPIIPAPPMLFELDRGERDTLMLAMAENADLVLLDERLGRNLAEYLGLRVTGTLGLLLKAKQQGLIPSFTVCAETMRQHGIFYSQALIRHLASQVGE